MIALDTSALIAMVLGEPTSERCAVTLENADRVLISAAAFAETFIVAMGRKVDLEIYRLLDKAAVEVIAVDEAAGRRIGKVYRRFGRGFHKASPNFGDCFSYDVAREYGCPLLYVGRNFALTDIASAF